MSKFLKFPNELKQWKIISKPTEINGNLFFDVSKKEPDGSEIKAKLEYVVFENEEYTSENVDFINEEAGFIKSVSKISDSSNYIDAFVNNVPTKEKVELYIFTTNSKTLSEFIKAKDYSERDIVELGINVSEILEKLEENNIYHGNINPDTIFIDDNGNVRLGGFTDFECDFSDKSFVAPEIVNGNNADFTTDIYSLGLIMYYLSNDKKMPFESSSEDKQSAINERLGGKSVSAPKNGGEKLKSVIVIACQSDNKNRWKNAGNVKNALTSIKAELPTEPKQNENIIIPQSTDFDGNVFEEYDYDDFEEEKDENADSVQEAENPDEEPPVEENENNTENPEEAPATTDNTQENSTDENNETKIFDNSKKEISVQDDNAEYDVADNQSEVKGTDDKGNVDEIESNVFENYEPTKVINIKEEPKKDYGDYFEDEPKEELKAEKSGNTNNKAKNDVQPVEEENYDVFADEDKKDDSEEVKSDSKKQKTGLVALIIAIVVILLTLVGVCGYFAFANNWFGLGVVEETKATEQTTAETTQVATTQPTTVAPTTVAPTTEPVEKYVIPVVGYGYSYAKELLEAEGFVVEIGEYQYSHYYGEGYVISQTPNDTTLAKAGSVVTLNISLGLIQEETTVSTQPATQSNNSQSSESSYSGSTYSGNTSYMSQSEVSKMSDDELNIALNEIYARRGRIFSDSSLSAYFNSQSWYTPKYTADEFAKNVVFNEYEQANLQLLVNEQQKRGLR